MNRQYNLNWRLHYEAQRGNLEAVQAIVQAGANINYKDDDGYTALIIAVINNKDNVVEWLLQNGADVNTKQWQGGIPLMFAKTGSLVRLLARYGAEPIATNFAETAYEVFLERKEYDSIDAYLECGFPVPPVSKRLKREFIIKRDLKRWALLHGYHATEEQLVELEKVKQTYNGKQIYRAFYKLCKEVRNREKVG